MTKKLISLLYITLLLGLIFISSACNNEDAPTNCETVVNANGPAFLKVINELSEEIFVDLTSIIPLGAHTRPGACEIFGLPTGEHTITVENEAGNQNKDVNLMLDEDETFTLRVEPGFF